MSTIKSSSEHLVLNADGASKDIKFQANGVEKASISSAGAFTSTSIDATKLSGALPAIDGSALTNLPGGGKVLQVVQASSNVLTLVSANVWTSTGATATITPSSTASRIVAMCSWGELKHEPHTYSGNALRVMRDSTEVYISGFIDYDWMASNGGINAGISAQFMDSPNTTSAVTYDMQFQAWNVSGGINEQPNKNGSIILLMEIGA